MSAVFFMLHNILLIGILKARHDNWIQRKYSKTNLADISVIKERKKVSRKRNLLLILLRSLFLLQQVRMQNILFYTLHIINESNISILQAKWNGQYWMDRRP
jgi:hypothetical protein